MKATPLIVLPSVQARVELRPLPRSARQGFVRRHWFAACMLVVVGTGLLWSANVYRQQEFVLDQLQRESNGTSGDLTQAQARHTELERQVRLLQSDDYVAMLARERYGLVKPGETTFTTRAPDH